MVFVASPISRKAAIASLVAMALPSLALAQQQPSLGGAAPLDSVFSWDAQSPKPATAPANPAPPAAVPVPAAAPTGRMFKCPRLEEAEEPPFYQGSGGWFFRSSDRTEDIALNAQLLRELKRLDFALKARGTALVPLPLPTRVQFGAAFTGDLSADIMPRPDVLAANDQKFRDDLASIGMVTFPVPGAFGETEAFRRDAHWTTDGVKNIVQRLGVVINALPQTKDLPRKTYKTTATGAISPSLILEEEIQPFCDETFPREEMKTYRTEQSADTAADLFGDGATAAAAPDSAGADLLFGDAGKPSIALAGSSFGDDKYNVDGFLMQETGLEAANYAIAGGGPYSSLISYLSTVAEGNQIAPVIVWEFQRTGPFFSSAPLSFRQVIPAAKGVCAGKAQLRTEKIMLGAGKPHSMTLGAAEAMRGREDYINVRFGAPTVRDLFITFHFADGQREEVPLVLNVNVPQQSAFFMELPADIDAPVTSVTLSTGHADAITAEVQLCNGDPLTP
jgi:hypothetical protein